MQTQFVLYTQIAISVLNYMPCPIIKSKADRIYQHLHRTRPQTTQKCSFVAMGRFKINFSFICIFQHQKNFKWKNSCSSLAAGHSHTASIIDPFFLKYRFLPFNGLQRRILTFIWSRDNELINCK